MKNLRYFLYPTLLILFGSLFFQTCKGPKSAQNSIAGTYRTAFYNVENLFDTLDHVDKFDEDFTPEGKKKWNTERYRGKLLN